MRDFAICLLDIADVRSVNYSTDSDSAGVQVLIGEGINCEGGKALEEEEDNVAVS